VRESRPVQALAEGFYLLPFVGELAVEAVEAFDSGPTPLARLPLVIGVAFESDAILSGTEFQFDSPELGVEVTRGVVVLTRSFIISLNVSNQPDIFETSSLAVPVINLALSLEALLEVLPGTAVLAPFEGHSSEVVEAGGLADPITDLPFEVEALLIERFGVFVLAHIVSDCSEKRPLVAVQVAISIDSSSRWRRRAEWMPSTAPPAESSLKCPKNS